MILNKNIQTFIGCDANFEEATTVLFGVPFDGTTSFRPGTRFASQAIRLESFGIETYSPFLDKDLEDYSVLDAGDLDVTIGNKQKVLAEIEAFTTNILHHGKLPFMIGGEHLVTLPAFSSILQKYLDVVLIHVDAHTDLREDYMGEELSHATVLRRIWNLVGDNRIFQFGIRSGTKEEFQWSDEGHTYIEKFSVDTVATIKDKIGNTPVYITIDLDVLDPSIFPGTGTPEAGGLTYKELESLFPLFTEMNIVGADIVELAPHFDHSGVSTAVACKVIREMLLVINS